MNGTRIWSKSYSFKASPYPGQDSLQRVVIFGDIGKVFLLFLISILLHIDNNLVFSFASLESSSDKFLQVEADGSSEFNNFQPGSLNTKVLKNARR